MEIDSAFANGTLSPLITYTEALKLPYLDACIKEGMRMHPSAALPLPRHVPSGGSIISDTYIPGGYRIGINPTVISKDEEVFGLDAEDYNPERWLEGDKMKMERTMMSFGAGTRTCIGKNVIAGPFFKLWRTN